MSVALADPIRMLIFGCMNTDKANNSLRADQKERALVAGLQVKNAASDVLELAHGKTGAVADGLNKVSGTIETARNSSKIFDGVCKSVNILSKLVNPILCVASAVRAYKAEDKKSASIKELGAMSFMFAAEGAYKKLFGLGGNVAHYQNCKILNKIVTAGKNFCKSNKYLGKLPQGKLGGLVKALGFIVTSCGAFELGSRTGKFIADNTTAKAYAKTHPKPEPQAPLEKMNDKENEPKPTKEFVA